MSNKESQIYRYGGQAVMEGVMMRGKKKIATSVRRPNGEIVTRTQDLSSFYTGFFRKTPFLRGTVALCESLLLGMSALMFSADIALEEEDAEKKEEVKEKEQKKEKKNGVIDASMWLMVALSLALSIAIFFMAPLFITRLLEPLLGGSSLAFNLVEGVIRIAIFLTYMWLVGYMKDIKRVFMYHGAEHKTINAYEAGAKLVPEEVRNYSTCHTRCGTAFLLIVMVVAVLVHSLLGKHVMWIMVLIRLGMLPVVAGISYEIIQFNARHIDNPIIRVFIQPGLWLQKLSTRMPTDDMLECAIASLKAVLEDDDPQKGVVTDGVQPVQEQ
ncbi:MAG: DUF1385 domain-containing protein [Dehalococcoidales bacterium]|nr:DUF1385 domain-containing protein [Dehalococcoidales bacterium]